MSPWTPCSCTAENYIARTPFLAWRMVKQYIPLSSNDHQPHLPSIIPFLGAYCCLMFARSSLLRDGYFSFLAGRGFILHELPLALLLQSSHGRGLNMFAHHHSARFSSARMEGTPLYRSWKLGPEHRCGALDWCLMISSTWQAVSEHCWNTDILLSEHSRHCL